MLRFYLKKNMKDIFGHLILIVLPVVLILLMHFINISNFGNELTGDAYDAFTVFITFGFLLMFQIYGSAIAYEGLGKEFYSGIIERLKVAPINLKHIVIFNLVTSIIVNFLQSLAVVTAAFIFLEMPLDAPFLVLFIVLLSVIFNQLLGVFILLATKSVKSTTTITTVYGIIAPLAMGLYFPLPENPIFDFLKNFSTPASLAFTAINGTYSHNNQNILIGIVTLTVLSVLLYLLLKPFIRRTTHDL